MNEELTNNVAEVAVEATKEAANSPLNWKLIGIVTGAAVLTGGVAVAAYFGIKKAKAKKAAKAAEVTEANAEDDNVEESK